MRAGSHQLEASDKADAIQAGKLTFEITILGKGKLESGRATATPTSKEKVCRPARGDRSNAGSNAQRDPSGLLSKTRLVKIKPMKATEEKPKAKKPKTEEIGGKQQLILVH